MPAVSKSQYKYAQGIAHESIKASAAKKAWADEMVSKSDSVDVSALPEHKPPEYAGFRRKKKGFARYGVK